MTSEQFIKSKYPTTECFQTNINGKSLYYIGIQEESGINMIGEFKKTQREALENAKDRIREHIILIDYIARSMK
jgi:hypothetical protein